MLIYAPSLDLHTELATLYLPGALRGPDIDLARALRAARPLTIHLLRLGLRDVAKTDPSVRNGVAALVKDWRRTRGGAVLMQLADTVARSRVADQGLPHAFGPECADA